ncbi:MAG: HAMP domain-containing sensor histidine kinase [Planctomycetaceae bacterium]|nr:HAMP domain-containing sensor histidine kinase [Planctomycetaceae bacterium]
MNPGPDPRPTDSDDAWDAELLVNAVAHDLKAPLVTIQGFLAGLEGAARAQDWERFQSDSQRIQRACSRMRQLLDDLREFAHQGQSLRQTSRVSLAAVVADALEQLAGVQPEAVSVTVDQDLPEIQGDRLRLMRAVQNVLENAFRSVCGRQSPSVDVSAIRQGDRIGLLIRDNGQGISPEEIPRIFQPYRQLSGRTGASGLGLAIAQRIARAHGGDLTLDSPGIGQGATVTLTFPRD